MTSSSRPTSPPPPTPPPTDNEAAARAAHVEAMVDAAPPLTPEQRVDLLVWVAAFQRHNAPPPVAKRARPRRGRRA